MSLQLIAKELESKGQKGDSMLVHMTPGEVAGLQKLAQHAGGSLSVNPETGLVEANFLKSILPTLVGAGVTMFAGPIAGAAAGAAVGGYQAKRAGTDVGMGALMGGLGGYGGGQLVGSLGAAGAATSVGTGMGAGAAGSAVPAQVAGSSLGATGAATGAGSQSALLAAQNAGVPLSQAASYTGPGLSASQVGQGIKSLGGAQGRTAALDFLGGGRGAFRTGMMAAAPMASATTEEAAAESPYPLMSMDMNSRLGGGGGGGGGAFQDLSAYEGAMPSYSGGSGNVFIPTFRAAQGGLATLAEGGMKEGGFVVPADVVSFLGGGNSDNGAEQITEMFPTAEYIDGPDGGQADTVETNIEGKQPARVAHGEVYLPPPEVQRAGGAEVLYGMLDRVRKEATGRTQQIKPVDLERAMA
jgi:hypothetical protein